MDDEPSILEPLHLLRPGIWAVVDRRVHGTDSVIGGTAGYKYGVDVVVRIHCDTCCCFGVDPGMCGAPGVASFRMKTGGILDTPWHRWALDLAVRHARSTPHRSAVRLRYPMKKTLYVDMDNVLVDFPSGIARLSDDAKAEFQGRYDDAPGIFALMDPMPVALDSYRRLAVEFDTYILSTAPWGNPAAWQQKVQWVQAHLGSGPTSPAYKRLILTHHKNLNRGDFLVDDRTARGADRFEGEHVHFGREPFPHWPAVEAYLLERR